MKDFTKSRRQDAKLTREISVPPHNERNAPISLKRPFSGLMPIMISCAFVFSLAFMYFTMGAKLFNSKAYDAVDQILSEDIRQMSFPKQPLKVRGIQEGAQHPPMNALLCGESEATLLIPQSKIHLETFISKKSSCVSGSPCLMRRRIWMS